MDTKALDATALAALVARREASPLELVEATIARIEAENGALNAVIHKTYDAARSAAAGPLPAGPFAGVPFLVKDVIATLAGTPRTEGSALGLGNISDHDSELVARQKRAGLIVVGKTNVPELGILPTTEPKVHGATKNPWDLSRSTGGSSGGAAAAVAAGWLPMAHASDGGGSIRIPASCCGLFGLKPTRARNPLGPDHGDVFHGLVVEHAVTRSVRDSAALLDATSGPDVGDPYAAPAPERPFLEEVGREPGRLRIGFIKQSATGSPVHPDCVAAVEDAARLLAGLGHDLEEAMPPVDGPTMTQAFITLWAGCNGWSVDALAAATHRKPSPENLEPLTWALYQMAERTTSVAHLKGLSALQRVARQFSGYFVDHDLLLTPTLGEPPALLGSFESTPENPLAGLFRAALYTPFTPIANVTGQPAMSLPTFWSGRLPIGVQLIGRFGAEGTLFRVAAQVEAARPWKDRWP